VPIFRHLKAIFKRGAQLASAPVVDKGDLHKSVKPVAASTRRFLSNCSAKVPQTDVIKH
jgi:hypothetical protein